MLMDNTIIGNYKLDRWILLVIKMILGIFEHTIKYVIWAYYFNVSVNFMKIRRNSIEEGII